MHVITGINKYISGFYLQHAFKGSNPIEKSQSYDSNFSLEVENFQNSFKIILLLAILKFLHIVGRLQQNSMEYSMKYEELKRSYTNSQFVLKMH